MEEKSWIISKHKNIIETNIPWNFFFYQKLKKNEERSNLSFQILHTHAIYNAVIQKYISILNAGSFNCVKSIQNKEFV